MSSLKYLLKYSVFKLGFIEAERYNDYLSMFEKNKSIDYKKAKGKKNKIDQILEFINSSNKGQLSEIDKHTNILLKNDLFIFLKKIPKRKLRKDITETTIEDLKKQFLSTINSMETIQTQDMKRLLVQNYEQINKNQKSLQLLKLFVQKVNNEKFQNQKEID